MALNCVKLIDKLLALLVKICFAGSNIVSNSMVACVLGRIILAFFMVRSLWILVAIKFCSLSIIMASSEFRDVVGEEGAGLLLSVKEKKASSADVPSSVQSA